LRERNSQREDSWDVLKGPLKKLKSSQNQRRFYPNMTLKTFYDKNCLKIFSFILKNVTTFFLWRFWSNRLGNDVVKTIFYSSDSFCSIHSLNNFFHFIIKYSKNEFLLNKSLFLSLKDISIQLQLRIWNSKVSNRKWYSESSNYNEIHDQSTFIQFEKESEGVAIWYLEDF